MYPKVRSPILAWLLTVISGGLYFFVWVWLVTKEINSAEERNVFPIQCWKNIAILSLILEIIGFIVAIKVNNPILLLLVALLIFGLISHAQTSIGSYIKNKDLELRTGEKFSNLLSVVLFWLVANTGVAYMQSGINRIIRNEQSRS